MVFTGHEPNSALNLSSLIFTMGKDASAFTLSCPRYHSERPWKVSLAPAHHLGKTARFLEQPPVALDISGILQTEPVDSHFRLCPGQIVRNPVAHPLALLGLVHVFAAPASLIADLLLYAIHRALRQNSYIPSPLCGRHSRRSAFLGALLPVAQRTFDQDSHVSPYILYSFSTFSIFLLLELLG